MAVLLLADGSSDGRVGRGDSSKSYIAVLENNGPAQAITCMLLFQPLCSN